MRLPTRKGRPKLPPTPRGGGAAARQRQFELERGLDPQVSPLGGSGSDRANGEKDQEKEDKDK
jgi:hypothetical protein